MAKVQRILAVVAAAALATGLTACSGGAKPQASGGNQGETAKDCVSKITPAKPIEVKVQPVDGEVPAVTGGANFGEKPTIAEGAGNPPKQLIRKTLVKGNGPALTPFSAVSVHYLGKLWQGGIFDNSYDRGEPSTFSLQGVVPGWTWGLNGAHVGDRVELVIPSELGYPNGSGDKIPPGSTLVFVVDIVAMPFTPPQHSEADLAKMTELLKQATPTKETLPAGLEIGCGLGQEPQISFQKDAKEPDKPTSVWLSTGKGQEITENDYVGYLTVGGTWAGETGSAWTDGSGVKFTAAKDTIFAGKTVGSRLAIVMPVTSQGVTPAPQGSAIVQIVDLVDAVSTVK